MHHLGTEPDNQRNTSQYESPGCCVFIAEVTRRLAFFSDLPAEEKINSLRLNTLRPALSRISRRGFGSPKGVQLPCAVAPLVHAVIAFRRHSAIRLSFRTDRSRCLDIDWGLRRLGMMVPHSYKKARGSHHKKRIVQWKKETNE